LQVDHYPESHRCPFYHGLEIMQIVCDPNADFVKLLMNGYSEVEGKVEQDDALKTGLWVYKMRRVRGP
jgi:hypothetical protein